MLQGKRSSRCQKSDLLSTSNLQDSCPGWLLVIHGKGTQLLEYLKQCSFHMLCPEALKEMKSLREVRVQPDTSLRSPNAPREWRCPKGEFLSLRIRTGRGMQTPDLQPSSPRSCHLFTSVTPFSQANPKWLEILALPTSASTLWMCLLCIPLKHRGKQGPLMNSVVYDDNTFLSPAIDLPSKLIKRANLARFTAPSLSVMSEPTEPVCFSKFK